MYVNECRCMCIYIYRRMYVATLMYVCKCIYMWCACLCKHTLTHTHTRSCTHVYVHIYLHTHTQYITYLHATSGQMNPHFWHQTWQGTCCTSEPPATSELCLFRSRRHSVRSRAASEARSTRRRHGKVSCMTTANHMRSEKCVSKPQKPWRFWNKAETIMIKTNSKDV